MTTLIDYSTQCQQRIQHYFESWLADLEDTSNDDRKTLIAATRYMLMNGGKRFRPLLVYASGESLGADKSQLDTAACAIEMLHTYSLIHDDLPAMDDDDIRRGQASCHKQFDQATAILCGDMLQAAAFDLLSQTDIKAEICVQLLRTLSQASGFHGMVGGQALDLATQPLNLEQLEQIHRLKTGALIQASVQLGAIVADADNTSAKMQLDNYAKNIGLAFQIRDDILDTNQDSGNNTDTASYPLLIGLEKSKQLLMQLVTDAKQSLAEFDDKADTLRLLADYAATWND